MVYDFPEPGDTVTVYNSKYQTENNPSDVKEEIGRGEETESNSVLLAK